MNKQELLKSVAKTAQITNVAALAAVEAFIEAVKGALKKGEKVQLVGFGTFDIKYRKARKGRNPQTGEEIDIEAANVPVFKAGKDLRDAVEKLEAVE